MNSSEWSYLFIFGAIVVVAPLIPTDTLLVLDHIVTRVAVIGALLWLIKKDRMLALFGLIAIAVLYVERNRRKVDRALKKLEQMDAKESPATLEEGLSPQKTVPVRSFDQPDEDEFDFLPKEEDFNDLNFDPVAPSMNYKSTLSSVYPHNGSPSASSTEELYEQLGFGHVKGVATLGNE